MVGIFLDLALAQNRPPVGTMPVGVIVVEATVAEAVMLEALIVHHLVRAPLIGEWGVGQVFEEDLLAMKEEVHTDHLALVPEAIQYAQAGLGAGRIPRDLQVALAAAHIHHTLVTHAVIVVVVAVAVAAVAAVTHLEVEDVEVIAEMIYVTLVPVLDLDLFVAMTEYYNLSALRGSHVFVLL